MSIKVKIFRSRIILVASHFSLHKLPARTTHTGTFEDGLDFRGLLFPPNSSLKQPRRARAALVNGREDVNGVFWVSIPHILELHRRQGLARWCSHLFLCSGKRGCIPSMCKTTQGKSCPAHRWNTKCSLEMRIKCKSCCLCRAEENTEGFCGVNMYKHFSSLHGSADFVSTLPTEINQFTRGQVRGHLALKSAENVFPEGSLIFLWCFVSEVCVCVLQGLGILEIRAMGMRLWYCTEYSWNIRIWMWPPF